MVPVERPEGYFTLFGDPVRANVSMVGMKGLGIVLSQTIPMAPRASISMGPRQLTEEIGGPVDVAVLAIWKYDDHQVSSQEIPHTWHSGRGGNGA